MVKCPLMNILIYMRLQMMVFPQLSNFCPSDTPHSFLYLGLSTLESHYEYLSFCYIFIIMALSSMRKMQVIPPQYIQQGYNKIITNNNINKQICIFDAHKQLLALNCYNLEECLQIKTITHNSYFFKLLGQITDLYPDYSHVSCLTVQQRPIISC